MTISSAGIAIELYLVPFRFAMYLVPIYELQYEYKLTILSTHRPRHRAIIIQREWPTGYFRRVAIDGSYLFDMPEGINLYTGQFRRVVLFRTCVKQLSSENLVEVEKYGFAIHRLAAVYSDFIEPSDSKNVMSSAINGSVSLMSQTPFSQDSQFLSIKPGSVGIAGKVCFNSANLNSVHLYFRFDFNFNPFCLAIHVQPIHSKSSEAPSEDLTISIPSFRRQPYLVESAEDMIDLARELRKNTHKIWNLQHDHAEFCLGSWKDNAYEFCIRRAIIRLDRWSGGYTVSVQPTFPVTHERKSKDNWYVSPWDGVVSVTNRWFDTTGGCHNREEMLTSGGV